VSPINFDKLRRLPVTRPDAHARLEHALSWVLNPAMYHGVPVSDPIPYDHLSDEHHALLTRNGYTEPHPVGEPILGTVRNFTREEHIGTAKHRVRKLGWTYDINEFTKSVALCYNLHTNKWTIRQAVKRETVAAQIDFSEYFSMFLMGDKVRNYFVYRRPDGSLWRNTRGSMGQRQSSLYAGLVTDHVCDVPLPAGVSVVTATDNIRVAGPRDGVIEVLSEIVHRALACNFTINELTDYRAGSPADLLADCTKIRTFVESLITSSYTFLGEAYDHDSETQWSTDKSVSKLKATLEVLKAGLGDDSLTAREIVTHHGIATYMSSTQRIPVYHYPLTCRWMRSLAQKLQERDDLWDVPLASPPPDGVRSEMLRWAERLLANRPVPVVFPPGMATHVAMSDASGTGYAAVVWNVASGSCTLIRDTWPPGLAGMDKSVNAEPEAIWRTLCRTFNTDDLPHVRLIFFTDHDSFTKAQLSGNPKGYSYGNALREIDAHLPGLVIELRHVAGTKNYVDGWSRGDTHELDEADAIAALQGTLGDDGLVMSLEHRRALGLPYLGHDNADGGRDDGLPSSQFYPR
jgi:hypothetical protein